MVRPISLAIQPPRPVYCQPLACKPLPNEWKVCYVAKKTWELIGLALNKALEWTAKAVLFACQSAATVVGVVLTAPIAVLQILFKAIFSPARLTNYTIGKSTQPLTQKHLSKTLQALANRGKGVENLTIQHGSAQPVECNESLIGHLGLLKLKTLRFVKCELSEELKRKLESVLDFELKETASNQTLWVKQQRVAEETISIASRQEFIDAIQQLNAHEKRVSVLCVVGNRNEEVSNIKLSEEESKQLRQLRLHALHLEGCMLTTDVALANESFSVHLYGSKKLLEDLEDRQKVAR